MIVDVNLSFAKCSSYSLLFLLKLTVLNHFVEIFDKVHTTLQFRIKQEKILFFFGCFILLHVLIWDFLFIKSPPVLLIFKKKFPPTLLFGTPVIFRTLEYVLDMMYINQVITGGT